MSETIEAEDMPSKTDQELFDEFLKKQSTLPPDLIITLSNFASEEVAQKCGNAVRSYLEIFGRLMDLSRLDRVFVAFDYDEALLSLDRGFVAKKPLKPTKDDVAVGVAMTPSVKRDGQWKSVIVFNAEWAQALSYEPDASFTDLEGLEKLKRQVIAILAHECGHVHDHAKQVQSLPTDTMEKSWSPLEHALNEPASACWSEYIACRLSAHWGNEDTLRDYESTFCVRLERAWLAITKSIRVYRLHGSVDQVLLEVGTELRGVVLYASYLIGHLDGLGMTLEGGAPDASRQIQTYPELGEFIVRLHAECRRLWDIYPHFPSLAVFDPLSELIHDVYKKAGLTLSTAGDGMHVDIPHRSDTLPSMAEQLEFMASRRVDA